MHKNQFFIFLCIITYSKKYVNYTSNVILKKNNKVYTIFYTNDLNQSIVHRMCVCAKGCFKVIV